ncbi:MAG: helix-hairpin-helix domain-containing protein [Desulfurococcales archaeon]|nr:helix-hairpin-helix domain-containing protein [Desulfurococcales archaeon]
MGEQKSKKTKTIVYADYREEKSGIPQLIEAEGVPVIRKNLPIGDYIVSGEIVIERKTAWDFTKSLFDGRLFDQAKRMAEGYPHVIFIVEGNPLRLRRYSSKRRQLLAALASLTVDYGSRIIYTEGPEDTAYMIASIARRLEKEGRRGVIIRKKAKLETIDDWQLFILQSFPGIGERTAIRIMETFNTIREFCNAPMSVLSKIEGIGEKRAELIFTILNRRFPRSKTRRKTTTLEDFYGENA